MANPKDYTDNELRGIILQEFYNRRKGQNFESPSSEWFNEEISNDDIYRICTQLGDYGLIKWTPFMGDSGVGMITANGVDVIEGSRSPDISVKLVQNYTTNVSNSSNVIVGDNNSIATENAFDEISKAIESSSKDEADKASSKSLLAQLAKSPVFAQIAGQLAKFAFDHIN
jgi:hypothetical protein